ncbi:LysR substrate-binding domain-containing protein [Rhodovulum sp. DZ06]|uniref:LysR substrate-binding domain-containing protein n=1 Tax=Rhodovulum sp. DZ06 TaxID=3425126 RepID=UPI003D3346F1
MTAPSRIRMRHLRCFLAIARVGSVTGAAEALGTVQPAVSRTLRELEQELGAPLFDRAGGRMTLTDAGRMLHAHAGAGLGLVDRGIEALRGRNTAERVSVFALPNVVRVVMPGAVARFRALAPDADLLIETVSSGLMVDRLAQGKVDFGFGRLNRVERMQGMAFEHLYDEPLVFFARVGHPLAGRQGVTAAEIDDYDTVLPTQGTIIREELDRWLAAQGLDRFTRRIETLSFEFARSYLRTGDAVVCLPLGALREELERGALVRLSTDAAEGLMGAVGLTTQPGRPAGPGVEILKQAIRDEVRSMGLDKGRAS